MSIFHELFKKSNNKPTNYQGEIIYLVDYIDLNKDDLLVTKLISTNTKHKVRFSLKVSEPNKKKYLEANGKVWFGFLFWEDTFPKEGTEIKVLNDGVKIAVSSGFASIWYWPMMIQKHGNKRIYHCYTDDYEDFTGFIFEIEIKKAN